MLIGGFWTGKEDSVLKLSFKTFTCSKTIKQARKIFFYDITVSNMIKQIYTKSVLLYYCQCFEF